MKFYEVNIINCDTVNIYYYSYANRHLLKLKCWFQDTLCKIAVIVLEGQKFCAMNKLSKETSKMSL